MAESTAPLWQGTIEIIANVERANGEIEHLKLIDGKWVPCEPEDSNGTNDQGS